MSNTIKWLWLSTKQGMTPMKIERLVTKYGDIDTIYRRRSYDVPYLTKADADRLCDKSLAKAERTYKSVLECGASILTCDNIYYPDCLRNIRPMPYVLYLKGVSMDLDSILGIGVVGTRINTDYGADCASKISYALGRRGCVIVSGMALGIDCIAMHAAVRAGAKTIGVLGCGIDRVYPRTNMRLFDEVVKTGLIISEYPPGIGPDKSNFPQRNRIIAGLSSGVLVVEGSKNSGSLITASFALEYNRDIFAIPRNINDKNAEGKLMNGTNILIQSGAKLVTCAEDILIEYESKMALLGIKENKNEIPYAAHTEINEHEQKKTAIEALLKKAGNATDRAVISLLAKEELYADEIAERLNLGISSISTALTIMETTGIVARRADGRYELK